MATKKQREIIYNKYGGKCAYCGCDLPDRWHIDHIIPVRRNRNGSMKRPKMDVIENYNPACPQCNLMKHSLSVENFRKLIEGFINSLNSYSNQYKFAKKYGLVHETNSSVTFYFEEYNHS